MSPVRLPARTAAAVLAVAALGSCGVRATPVPVDAGPAPSRMSCGGTGGEASQPADAVQARVFLVCGSGVVAVERSVHPSAAASGPDGSQRLAAARTLLGELRSEPSPAEGAAGLTSAVPEALRLRGPDGGDPGEALRLNRAPRSLPPLALAQLVCTFAGTAAVGGNRSVVLGGPDGRPLRYVCDNALRSSPEAAETAGSPL